MQMTFYILHMPLELKTPRAISIEYKYEIPQMQKRAKNSALLAVPIRWRQKKKKSRKKFFFLYSGENFSPLF